MKWKDITLYKFQQIELKNGEDIEEIDKTLFAVCYLFGYTEYELDRLPLKKVHRLIKKVENVFKGELKVKPLKRICKYIIEYRPERLTFGQYVELSFFFTMPPVQAAHYIMASISHLPFCKNNSAKHKKRADYFQTVSVVDVLGCIQKFTENFAEFNKRFQTLFAEGSEDKTEVKTDPFNIRYGWTYSASCVAEYERITLEQAYQLPVMQALNDLVYLKEKAAYDEKIINNARKNNSSQFTS